MNPYHPTILGPEGSAGVEELGNGSRGTPEPRAIVGQVRGRGEAGPRAGEASGTDLPEDHDAFVAARSLGLRAIRQKLAARRKRK